MKFSGELQVIRPERLTDSLNRSSEYLVLRHATAEPLAANYPVLSRKENEMILTKGAVVLAFPVADIPHGNATMWRDKEIQSVSINTEAFSLVGDIYLAPRQNLRDQLDRYRGDFLPVTNLSALWVTALNAETHAIQRPFGLLNPAAILSFAER